MNRLYETNPPQALYQLPLEILDVAHIVKFRNLDGGVIKNDGGTDVVGPTANMTTGIGKPNSPGSHVQVVYGIKKTVGDNTRSAELPDGVVTADINLRNVASEGIFEVRGFDGGGGKLAMGSINQLALVSFDAHGPHAGNWLACSTHQVMLAYYLPWKKNFSRVLKLGNAADFFFTSSLTGCSVQVYGSPTAPTVTHTNAGGIAETKDAQIYMTQLLNYNKDYGVGSWDPLKNYSQDLTAPHYRKMEKNYWERKLDNPAVQVDSSTVKPESRTIVVGFRSRTTGEWAFYYQQWVKVAYTKYRQAGPGKYEEVKKKKIAIKRVAQFWPDFRVLADSWKQEDFRDRTD